jgi:amino acid transporter
VVYGSVLGIGTYASLLLFFFVGSARIGPLNALNTMLLLTAVGLSLSFTPLSVGMAILRYRLWDIDLLIRRTLVYSLLTGLLAAVYFGSVVVLQAAFTALTGAARSELVTVVSTLAIAALFVPLRNKVQPFIDRRFFRRKYDAARTLASSELACATK